jgi:hypothetical protein
MAFALHKNQKGSGYQELHGDGHGKKLATIKPLPNTPQTM